MTIDTKNLFASFKARIETQMDIRGSEFRSLDTLDAVTELYESRDVVYSQGEPCHDMFVVADGWLIGSSTVVDGGRFLHRIYQTGDIIGAEDINWNYGSSTVEAVTSCILGRFPKANLFKLFQSDPALAAAFHSIAMNDAVVSTDIARANSRLNAAGRVGHLLLQVQARQALTSADVSDGVSLPLTQTQIADALGLTNVSVSRAVSELSERGMISRDGARYTLLKRDELVFQSNFVNRYLIDDHKWARSVRDGLSNVPVGRVDDVERDVTLVRSNTV